MFRSTTLRSALKRTGMSAVALAVLAATMTGCAASDEPDYVAICVNPATEERVDDTQCTTTAEYDEAGLSAGEFFWFYLAASALIPAVGSDVDIDSGTYKASKLGKKIKVLRGGMPTTGGTSYKTYKKSTTSTTKSGSGSFGSSSSKRRSGRR